MAAGLGTRLRPFTDREPKALLPVLGVPMAQFACDLLAGAGVKNIVANVHHLAEKARQGLLALDRESDVNLVISDESALLLGSAGGIRKALPEFRGNPFFLVNADVLSDVDLHALAVRHLYLRRLFGVTLTLTVFPPNPLGAYREISFDPHTGLIEHLGEVVRGKPYFMGAAVIEPEALANVPEGPAEFVPTILAPAVAERKAGVFYSSGLWHDVGSPELWLDTHLALIEKLEANTLPERIRKRIEIVNDRICPGIWVSKRAPGQLQTVQWQAPAYWDPLSSRVVAPKLLGPRAAVYGDPGPNASPLKDAIQFDGLIARMITN